MNQKTDQQMEELLREHLHGALDGQLGRSTAAFERDVQPRLRSNRSDAIRWSLATVTGLAAGLLIAWVLSGVLQPPQVTGPQALGPQAMGGPQGPQVVELPQGLLPAQDVERFVAWRMIPDGTAVIGDRLPVQRVRRQMIQQVEWFDPQDNARITLRKPKEDVVFVEINQN